MSSDGSSNEPSRKDARHAQPQQHHDRLRRSERTDRVLYETAGEAGMGGQQLFGLAGRRWNVDDRSALGGQGSERDAGAHHSELRDSRRESRVRAHQRPGSLGGTGALRAWRRCGHVAGDVRGFRRQLLPTGLAHAVTVGPGYSEWRFSQPSAKSATSRQPPSIVSECPRSWNSLKSVTAGDFRYCFRVDLVMAGGTVWSLPPAVSRSGPRVAFSVSTLPGE